MPKQEVVLRVNGEERMLVIRSADTLLHVLHRYLGLTGARPACENGDCGACTVIVDAVPYKSCIMLAMEAIGHSIRTVEGLFDAPIQRAFAACYAFQCGYCTPGFIMNGHALLQHHRTLDDRTIQEWLESNICRCTGYKEIGDAVKMAAQIQLHGTLTEQSEEEDFTNRR